MRRRRGHQGPRPPPQTPEPRRRQGADGEPIKLLYAAVRSHPARSQAPRFAAAGAAIAQELIHTPLGPDIHREIRAMSDAIGATRS